MNNDIKTKEIEKQKKAEGKYYMGFFEDGEGNPDFKGLGPILKGVLYLFLFSILLTDNNKYLLFFLFLFFVGRILTAIRLYYIDTLNERGSDVYFIRANIIQNFVEGFTALFVVLYILFHKFFDKK